MTQSPTHVVLLPTYNTGRRLLEVVTAALQHWQPVLVVVDGSTDGSHEPVMALAGRERGLEVLVLPRNRGKGAAVLAGLRHAVDRGCTHALVMDADGQHPADRIAEFMAASQCRPEAMILGQPVFGADAPAARRHGRKLSIGLVRLETRGRAIADPLFGFRVYPAQALLDVLGPRRGGRRYDFDTEAVVRLHWAGVPALNLPAPVRYFQPSEGGVSHFRYGRDNLRLAWMHTRLIAELLLVRWPALLRRRPRPVPRSVAVVPALLLALGLIGAVPVARAGGAEESIVAPAYRLALDPVDPAWLDLAAAMNRHTAVCAPFEERRWFPFRKTPVVLRGEVRIDATRGLSLHYELPQERIVLADHRGMLVREDGHESAPPADPRATAANDALLHVLRFEFAPLAATFELYGRRDDRAWTLTLVPKAEDLRRALGEIIVEGETDRPHRIVLRRSPVQRVEIIIGEPWPEVPFTDEDVRRFFR